MAFKTIQVNLQFNANVANAKKQISDLQSQLNHILSAQPATSQLSLTPQLQQAQQAAMQLKIALQNAVNTDTGKLNLGKFQTQLKQSGMTIQQLAGHLQALGPAGVQSFGQLAGAIAQADTRMFALGAKTKEFLTSISHSAKYQIASSLIYGIMNSFSQTIDYAKELDSSLNNIRIVTGKSSEEMARFAKEANKAAKEFSTTTTKYSDASLIYYQQGLSDREVAKRTETTIKLANVVGESAQEVSEWMTAIWNNFDDGSQSLEYYADVLATLGAATASSADEIATGLEKFSAVADTVGLSYEYAASALATITAETRQSADVVGTALKTLFARIEGLKLGDTLDDGTTLNQYSEALMKVGVDIKDANGELKDMDSILDAIGVRWQTLAADEQVALAQSVAGIRQYSQFMALMDNWDVMQENLDLTKEANGALEDQQKIYESSVQAAENRMNAAAEEFKALLVGGDDLTKVYNFMGGFIEVLADVFEAFGGLQTLFPAVAAALLKMYQPQVATMFSHMGLAAKDAWMHVANFATGKGWVGAGQAFQVDAMNLAKGMMGQQSDSTEGTTVSIQQEINELRIAQLKNANKLSEADNQIIDWNIQLISKYNEQLKLLEDQVAKKKELANASREEFIGENNYGEDAAYGKVEKVATAVGVAEGTSENSLNVIGQAKALGNINTQGRMELGTVLGDNLTNIEMQMKKAGASIKENLSFTEAQKALEDYVNKGKTSIDDLLQKFEQLDQSIKETGETALNTTIDDSADELALRTADKSYNQVSALGETTNWQDTANLVDQIDLRGTMFAGNEDAKTMIKDLRTQAKEVAKLEKGVKKGTVTQEEFNKAQEEFQKKAKEVSKAIKQDDKNKKSNMRNTEKYHKAIDKSTKGLKEAGTATKDGTKDATTFGAVIDNLVKKLQGLVDGANKGAVGVKTLASHFVSSLQTLAQFAMGLNMVNSAATSIATAFAEGDNSMSTWLSNVSSMGMGLMMIIPLLNTLSTKLRENTLAFITNTEHWIKNTGAKAASIISSLLHKKAIDGENKELEENNKELDKNTGKKIINAFAGIAAQIKDGIPALIAAAVATLPFILLAGAVVGGFSTGTAQAEDEKREEKIETGKEQLADIDEIQEAQTSLGALTEEYQKLAEAQESVHEISEDIAKQLPDLITKYKDLAGSLGLSEADFNIPELQNLLEAYKEFGTLDVDRIAEILNMNETKVAETEQDVANDTFGLIQANVASKVKKAKTEGSTRVSENGNIILDDFASGGVDTENIIKQVFGDAVKSGNDLELDISTPQALIDTYEKLQKVLKENDKKGWGHHKEAKILQQIADDLQSDYEAANEVSKSLVDSAKQLFQDKVIFDPATMTQETYEANRQNYLNLIKQTYPGLTDEEAEQVLANNSYAKKFEVTYDLFAKGGNIYADFQQGFGDTGQVVEDALNIIKAEYAKLPDEDKVLYLKMDFVAIGSAEDTVAEFYRQLEELRKARAAKQAEDERREAIQRKKTALDREKEIDRYHYLNSVLEEIEREYDRLGKAKDRAYGPNKLQYITSEISNLNNQIEAQKALNKQTEDYLKIDKQRLQDTFKAIQIDEETGLVKNAASIQASYINRLNGLDENSTEYKAVEADLQLFNTYLSNYENSLKQVKDGFDKLNDLEFDKAEKELEKIDNKVQNSVQLTEQELKGIEFQLSKIEDAAYSAAKKLTLLGKSFTANERSAQANAQGIRDILANKEGVDVDAVLDGDFSTINYEDLTQDEMDQLIQYQDELISSTQEMRQNWVDMHSAIDDAYSKTQEDLDFTSEKIEHQIGLLEDYNNIIDLLGTKNLGLDDSALALIDQAMVQGAQARVKTAQTRLEANTKILAGYEAQLAQAIADGDEARIAKWQEKVHTAQEQVQSDQRAVNEELANSIEIAQAARERATDTALKEFLQLSTGFDTLDEMQEYYDKQKQLSELYLSDYQKSYELAKMTRNIDKQINEISNTQAKQKLLDIQEKINKYQEDGVEMSEYELQNLQNQYNVELARVALEDAKSAKSQVRLQRDSSGNFSYVYTANQDKVNEAEQKYEDAVYNQMKTNEEYMASTQELMNQATEEFYNRIQEIQQDTTLSDEKRQKALEEAQSHYLELQNHYGRQLGIAINNNLQLYDSESQNQNENIQKMVQGHRDYITDWTNNFLPQVTKNVGAFDKSWDELTEAEKAAFVNMGINEKAYVSALTSEGGLLLGLSNSLLGDKNSAKSYYQQLQEAIGDPEKKNSLYGKIATANGQFNTNIEGTFSAANTDIDTWSGELPTKVSGITGEIGKITEEFEDISEDGTNSLGDATEDLGDWEKTNYPKLLSIEQQVDKITTAITNLITEWQKLAEKKDITKKITLVTEDTTQNFTSSDNTGSGSTGTPIGKITASDSEMGETIYNAKGESSKKLGSDYLDKGMEITGFTQNKGVNGGDHYTVSLSNGNTVYMNKDQLSRWTDLAEFTPQITEITNEYNPKDYKTAWNFLDIGPEAYFKSQEDDKYYRVTGLTPVDNADGTRSFFSKTGFGEPIPEDTIDIIKKGLTGVVVKNGTPQNTPAFNKDKLWSGQWWESSKIVPDYYWDATKKDFYAGTNNYGNHGLYVNTHFPDGYKRGYPLTDIKWSKALNSWMYEVEGKFGKCYIPEKYFNGKERKKLTSLDTGGYTGDWGPEGRLAMLHQKEIVLNAHDTENFLAAINIVRDISDQIEKNAIAMRYSASLGRVNAVYSGGLNSLQQDVTIHAEFPSVTDHNEIEIALADLVNQAAQFANRKF